MGQEHDVEGALAASYIDEKIRGARTAASRYPNDATTHSLSAAILTPIAEYLRLGGTPDGVVHALKVAEIAADELKDGLHIPDEPAEGGMVHYNP